MTNRIGVYKNRFPRRAGDGSASHVLGLAAAIHDVEMGRSNHVRLVERAEADLVAGIVEQGTQIVRRRAADENNSM